MNDINVNVRSAKVGDDIADAILRMPQNGSDREAVERFKDHIRSALSAEARNFGARKNSACALCDVVGPLALAQFVLAKDGRLIREKIVGVPLRLRGELPRPRRWRSPPLEVFERSVALFSPEVLFVVAPTKHDKDEYQRWVLAGRALAAIGVTKAGVDGVFRTFGGHARRHRVLLDGCIQMVRCLPEWSTCASLALFTEERLTRYPHWVEPRQRAKLAASAKQCDDAMCGRATDLLKVDTSSVRSGTFFSLA